MSTHDSTDYGTIYKEFFGIKGNTKYNMTTARYFKPHFRIKFLLCTLKISFKEGKIVFYIESNAEKTVSLYNITIFIVKLNISMWKRNVR